MDYQKDLEEYRQSCVMHKGGNETIYEVEQEDPDIENMEIVVRDLTLCRPKQGNLSVKDVPSEVEMEEGASSPSSKSLPEVEFDGQVTVCDLNQSASSTNALIVPPKPPKPPVKPKPKPNPKPQGKPKPSIPQKSSEFSKDEIPDVTVSKAVYNSNLSKDKTLPPPSKFTLEQMRHFKRNWICIGTLVLSSVLVIVIVVIVLLLSQSQ